MTRGATRSLLLAAASLALAIGACTLLNPLDSYGPGTAKPIQGAASAAPSAAAADASCPLNHWPGPPAKDDKEGAVDDLVFASASFAPGEGPTGAPIGYDLDNQCTCPGPSSCDPAAAVKSSCDGDGGVDSNGTAILDKLLTLSGKKDAVTQAIAAGRGGFVMRLAGYNGTADDTNVQLEVFGSNGTQPPTEGGDSPVPRHDGTDIWTVDGASVFGGAGPPFVSKSSDIAGYVSGGTLVARMDVHLNLADLVFDLRGVVITATIKRVGNVYSLEQGVLAGRWPTRTLLTSFDTLKDPFSPTGGLCGPSTLYQNVKTEVCSSVDLVQDPTKDNTHARCDAVGLTILFTGEQAMIGGVMNGKTAVHLCGDGYSDDCAP